MYILQVLCPLAVVLLCADVDARWWSYKAVIDQNKAFKLPSRQFKGYEVYLLKVTCEPSCTVREIHATVKIGAFALSAKSASTIICSKESKSCPNQVVLTEKEFFIYMKPDPEFTGGSIKVKLGTNQKGTIYEVRHESAFLYTPTCVRIFSGYHKVKFPNLLPQYRITCNGNCKILRIRGIDGNYVIAASEKPVSAKESGCYECFCVSSEKGKSKTCKIGRSGVINLQSDSFYITLVPDKEVQDAQAEVFLSNFKEITKFNLMDNRMIKDVRINGKPGAVWRFAGPFQEDRIHTFYIDFKVVRNDRQFSVKILTDAEVKLVYVTRTNYYPFDGYCQGQCTSCSCDTRRKCESFDAYLKDGQNPTNGRMKMRVVLKGGKSTSTAYLRISGNQLLKLKAVRKHWNPCP